MRIKLIEPKFRGGWAEQDELVHLTDRLEGMMEGVRWLLEQPRMMENGSLVQEDSAGV
jgi:hypothetical protein